MNKIILILILVFCASCQRPDPKYVLKSEVGDAAILHWEDTKEQLKYRRVKKSDIDKKRALEKRRLRRKEGRGKYIRRNPWDF